MLLLLLCQSLIANSYAELSSNWYYDHWCGSGLQYLNDGKCAKKFPSSYERDAWTCPVSHDHVPSGFYPDMELSKVNVDVSTLGNVVSNGANVCVVMTKRISEGESTKLYHKYFCAGEYSRDTAYETWSSSKIFAMANAAGHLRTNESKCSGMESKLGMDGSTTGKHGLTELGDLATVICSYDTTAGYTSNSLSSYFHDMGFRDRLNDLIQPNNWLLGAGSLASSQTLGGNYGEATPSDLGFKLTAADSEVCTVDKDPWPTIHTNTISALTAVELTRRIAQFHDIPDEVRFPGMKWEDAQTILYGAESSVQYPGLQWGGMSADPAIFVQSALNITQVEEDSRGTFRIFSKLGAGWSTSRYMGEIVSNAYACLPVLDSNGSPVKNEGLEFSVHVRGSIANDASLTKVEQQVHTAMVQTITAILENKLV